MAFAERRVLFCMLSTLLLATVVICVKDVADENINKESSIELRRVKRGLVNSRNDPADGAPVGKAQYPDMGRPKSRNLGDGNINQGEDGQDKPKGLEASRQGPFPAQGQMQPNPRIVQEAGVVPQKQQQVGKIKLSATTECAADVQRFCSVGVKDNNFAILDCLQNDERTSGQVSADCQNYLWEYKRQLTKDDRFDSAASEVCKQELEKFHDCQELPPGQGLIIPCLIEHFEEVSSKPCLNFLNKMASIVFSDYRLVFHFSENCQQDIRTLGCGRLPDQETDRSPHLQGRTIECLAKEMGKLTKDCKKQVLRVYELQSDDYHLDRPLYYACQHDRENLCADVKAGNGAVFQCLYSHLGEKVLSPKCQEKLELRQRVIAEDVKVEHVFYARCRDDIEKHSCLGGSVSEPDTKRAHVLLCLENVHMNAVAEDKPGSGLAPECVQEMMKVRKLLMDDYQISPELMVRCHGEIEEHCQGLEAGGKTLHCLMGLAKTKKKNKEKISSECKAQLSELLKEVNVGENFMLDRPLHLACSKVVETLCKNVHPGQGAIINCLMDNIDEDEMTDECEHRLLEIQYFMARDFTLDTDLYKSCKRDAKKYCHESGNWADTDSTNPDQGPLVLACLHRHYRNSSNDGQFPQLARACVQAMQRVMRQRSLAVNLNPEIEDACMRELAEMCSEDPEDVEKGKELECLQLKYDELGDQCKEVMRVFQEDEAEDIHMDHILMKACTPMIRKFCEDELEGNAEPDEVLECLVEHKNHADMSTKCRAGIEHHQLISMKDFRFNRKFKEACHRSVQELCKKMITKYDVVNCLSEHVRNDTLLDRKHRVEPDCRSQLKVELLQRGESIKLDPELERACSEDIEDHCSNINPGNAAILECLKKNQRNLHPDCHKVLFRREKDEFAIADYTLTKTCKRMIKKHCGDADSEPEILDCLKRVKDEDGFDISCRAVVMRRLITQARDYRLNPILWKDCIQDIPKFCAKVLETEKNDEELEGKVISCLKKQFAIKRLSTSCEHQIHDRVKAAALNIALAPTLMKACGKEIQDYCQKEMISSISDVAKMQVKDSGPGRVVECLKAKFHEQKISSEECRKEIIDMISESHVDINVDPLLQSACQRDLMKLCGQIPVGQGRQMSCLLLALDEQPRSMTVQCRDMLSKRKEMWEYAAQVAPLETLHDVYTSVVTSPSKTYFISVLFVAIGLIFIVGISCGRVTKRVRAEMKNK